MIPARALRVVVKPVVFVAALGPVAWLIWAGLTGHLSVNPLSDLTNETGLWALRFLCVSLAITPLRRLTGWNSLIRFRRMLGLYAFFYGSLHFLVYAIADRFAALDFPDGIVSWTTVRNLTASVGEDIYKRPFITIGFTTLMLMLPLAITSTAGWIRRLGGKRWNLLHRLAYVAGITAVVHYYWLVKADVRSPLLYIAIVAVLLGLRVYWSRMKAMAAAARLAQPAPRRA
ncbi:MAG TPA: protein-methionine-sulfoxide reductase heme-binding subunit MsrQ [Vicinamibacterales bacterium]|nr:protein-methionine-sulfoxide reductase heme-binding subunit MsrQ [Vicinamibacterales bacterium]